MEWANADALTSTAFLVAAAGIVAAHRRQTAFALLVGAVGVGSFVEHGPHPSWAAYVHDLPLTAVLLLIAADAVADLIGRELSPAWWGVPSVAMTAVVAAGPTASTVVQAVVGAAAIGLSLARAQVRPALRIPVIAALSIGAAGVVVDRVWHGHAVWHVLAAAALWQLGSAIGARGT